MNVIDNLRLMTEHLMKDIRTLEQSVNNVGVHLQNRTDSKGTLTDVRKALRALPKEGMNQLKIKRDWDMKQLYAEVLKARYKRNELRTADQKVSRVFAHTPYELLYSRLNLNQPRKAMKSPTSTMLFGGILVTKPRFIIK